MSATWLIHICDMTHSYVCYDSFICVLRLIHMCEMRATWLTHMCDMAHSYVCYDSFICVKWVRHDSLICVIYLIHMCAMPHSYMWNDWFICGALLIHLWYWPLRLKYCRWAIFSVDSSICVLWLIYMCEMTHSYAEHYSFTCDIRGDRYICVGQCFFSHPYVRYDSFMCEITDSYAEHHSFTCDTRGDRYIWIVAVCCNVLQCSAVCCSALQYTCGASLIHMWCSRWPLHLNSRRWAIFLINSSTCVKWLIHMCEITHSYVGDPSFAYDIRGDQCIWIVVVDYFFHDGTTNILLYFRISLFLSRPTPPPPISMVAVEHVC